MIPVNNGFAESTDGIEIFVFASDIHADVIVPVKSEVIDWRPLFPAECFPKRRTSFSHMAFGWGDRGFYLHTPTWDDLEVSTALSALCLPSGAVMHVAQFNRPRESDRCRRIVISNDQYARLVKHIQNAFLLDEGESCQLIPSFSYTGNDAFFEAKGHYTMFTTCNNWAGRGLKNAGVKVGYWTPLPSMVLYHLPEPEQD